MKLCVSCVRKEMGGAKVVTVDCKSMLVMDNYKNVHNGHSQDVPWEKSCH
jgi:hypothetical protein